MELPPRFRAGFFQLDYVEEVVIGTLDSIGSGSGFVVVPGVEHERLFADGVGAAARVSISLHPCLLLCLLLFYYLLKY